MCHPWPWDGPGGWVDGGYGSVEGWAREGGHSVFGHAAGREGASMQTQGRWRRTSGHGNVLIEG